VNGRGRLSSSVEGDGIATHHRPGDVASQLNLKTAAGADDVGCCTCTVDSSRLCVSHGDMPVSVYSASRKEGRCNQVVVVVLRPAVGKDGRHMVE
jgi:hypothetical protein